MPLFCSRVLLGKQGHVHSTIPSHQRHRVFNFVTKTDWNRRLALRHRHGHHSRMPQDGWKVTLRWRPTGLLLGDALTKDTADDADLLRAYERASAHQLAAESSMSKRAGEEREARSLMKAHGEVRGHWRRTADENVSGRSHRRGTERSHRQPQRRGACE